MRRLRPPMLFRLWLRISNCLRRLAFHYGREGYLPTKSDSRATPCPKWPRFQCQDSNAKRGRPPAGTSAPAGKAVGALVLPALLVVARPPQLGSSAECDGKTISFRRGTGDERRDVPLRERYAARRKRQGL